MAQSCAAHHLPLEQLEERRAARFLRRDGEQGIPVVGVRERAFRTAWLGKDAPRGLLAVGDALRHVGRVGQARSVREQLVERDVAARYDVGQFQLAEILKPENQRRGERLGDGSHPEGRPWRNAVGARDRSLFRLFDADHAMELQRKQQRKNQLLPFFSSVRMSLAMDLSVSYTPSPFGATASKWGTRLGLSRFSSSSIGAALGRSRLLYWMT